MVESKVVFCRGRENKKESEYMLEVDEEYVSIKDRGQGTWTINIRGSKEALTPMYEFFDNVMDLEPLTMNIAGTGEIKHYFRGISDIKEEEDEGNYKFGVTLQLLKKSV
ncbi:hypothetical protein [Methanobacterium aggregans]|uniref:hypothetical protein n=1 Tax=Methanobacterium aggregans TaxID=1615586 RepID=UPI001AE81816|nr:hypothetical protein [Methanobacterium aggregans]MBP2045797.1 hypothetical protein [Methanobacterium aggregans]